MGGRVAEEKIFGYSQVTSGASSDIKQATKMARSMVREWGMSDDIGPIFYGNDSADMYSGSNSHKLYSTKTEDLIDHEVKALVEEGYNAAKKILNDYEDELHIIAKALLARETLTGQEIREMLHIPESTSHDSKTSKKKATKMKANESSE